METLRGKERQEGPRGVQAMPSFGWQLPPVRIGVTGWERAGAHLALEPEMDRAWGVVAGWMVRKS